MAALDRTVASRIARAIVDLAAGTRADVKRLKGENPARYRLRVGDWRVIFERRVDDLTVLRVLHRREAYR